MKQVIALVAACAVGWGLCLSAARAHDVKGSVMFVDLGQTRVHIELELPLDELRLSLGMASQPGVVELPASGEQIAQHVGEHVRITTPDGRPFSLRAWPRDVVLHDQRNWQRIELDAEPPARGSARDFVLESDVITQRVVSHRIFVFLRRDLAQGQLGEPVYLDTLHYQKTTTHVRRASGSLHTGLAALVRLGAAHIAEGSDHLLFLFTLLLPAGLGVATRGRWGARRGARAASIQVLKIVSAFTLGHSLTLLLSALGLAALPSALVESLIALSVLVSALHAIVPLFPRREAWVGFGFGLIHGLGFATALEGFGIDGQTLALSVLGFNLGVEAMQIALILVSLPAIYLMHGTRLAVPFRNVCGALACLMALAWLVERAHA